MKPTLHLLALGACALLAACAPDQQKPAAAPAGTPTTGTTVAPVAPVLTGTGTGPALNLYKDGLASGIEDWSWSQDKKNFGVDDPALGLKSIMFDFKPNAGLSLYFGKQYPVTQFSKLVMEINIGDNKSANLDVRFQAENGDGPGDSDNQVLKLTKSNEWEKVTIKLADFKKVPTGLTRVNIMYFGETDIKPIYFDNISLEP